ncbi:MAG: O-antigen ligase family protein [Firmicutes bacterium]|nr:O-antigen ligase family protein [Bacillota bacterium]
MNDIPDKREKKIFYTLYILLIASVVLAFSTIFNESFVAPKRFFLRGFTILLIVFWSFIQVKYGFRLPSYKAIYASAAYFAFVLVSLFVSRSILQGIPQVVDLACYLAIFLITLTFINKEDTARTGTFLLAISIPVSIYSVMQHLGVDPVSWEQVDLIKNRSISTLGNPDFLSAFLVLVIPVAFCMSFRKETKAGGIPELIIWAFNCAVLIGTYSRAGLLALIAGFIISLFFIGKTVLLENKKKLVAIVLLIALAAGLVLLMEKTGETRHTLQERVSGVVTMKDNNVSTRLYLWQAALKIIEKSPVFGTGPNTFQFSYLPYRNLEPVGIRARIAIAESPHNYYLDIACSSGIPALLALFVILGITYYGGFKSFYSGSSDKNESDKPSIIRLTGDDRLIAAGFLAGITSYLVHHLAGYPTLPDELLFWVYLGFCQILFFGKQVLWEAKPVVKMADLRAAVMIVVVFSAIILLISSFRLLSSDYFFNRARGFQSSIDSVTEYKWKEYCVNKAEESYAKALENDPVNPKIWLQRGKLYEQFLGINIIKDNNNSLFQTAYKSYTLAIKLNPRDPYPHADLGRLCRNWSDPVIAEKAYRQALMLDPYNVLFMTDLAILCQDQKRNDEAEFLFKKVIEIYPEGAWVYGNIGVFYNTKGDKAKAVEYLNKCLAIDPNAERYKAVLDKIK